MATYSLAPTAGTGSVTAGTFYDYSYNGTAWSEGSSRTTTLADYLNEVITTSASSGDTGVGLTAGANTTGTFTVGLDAFPGNFAGLDYLDDIELKYSMVDFGSRSDDPARFYAQIKSADGTLTYSTQATISNYSGTSWEFPGAPAYNMVTTTMYADANGGAASVADWNSCIVEFTAIDTKSKGSDNSAIILVDVELTGTYTAAAPTTYERTGTIAGTSTLTADAEKFSVHERTGTIAGTSTFTADGSKPAVHERTGSIAGTSTLAADAESFSVHERTGTISSTSTLTADSEKFSIHERTGTISGTSTLSADGAKLSIHERTGTISGTSTLSANGIKVGQVLINQLKQHNGTSWEAVVTKHGVGWPVVQQTNFE